MTTAFYFDDPLLPFHKFLSGWESHITVNALGTRSKVQDMAVVWDDYRGAGVTVGLFGTEAMSIDRLHPDLQANYITDYLDHYDPLDGLTVEGAGIGTFMAGFIAADDNGQGMVGIAPDAGIYRYTGLGDEDPDILVGMSEVGTPYGKSAEATEAVAATLIQGRDGLGTIAVYPGVIDDSDSSARTRWSFDPEETGGVRVNGPLNGQFAIPSQREFITVAAIDETGWERSNNPDYLPGAMTLLVVPVYHERLDAGFVTSEPLVGLAATSDPEADGGGTSLWGILAQSVAPSETRLDLAGLQLDLAGEAAAPVTGGAVALMLETNPDLGWRDVQEILAYSADPLTVWAAPYIDQLTVEQLDADGFDTVSIPDGHVSQTWNGGELLFSHVYGFGALDIRAAVRLAESWDAFGDGPKTSANEISRSATLITEDSQLEAAPVFVDRGPLLPDHVFNPGPWSVAFDAPEAAMEIETVSLRVEMELAPEVGIFTTDDPAGSIGIKLISPDGQVSLLAAGNDPGFGSLGYGGTTLDWTFSSRAFLGQDADQADGVWTAEFLYFETSANSNSSPFRGAEITEIDLTFHGADASEDDVYVYTDALVTLATTAADPAYGLPDGAKAIEASGHGGVITDGSGRDVINATAMTHDLVLLSEPGGAGGAALDGQTIVMYTLDAGTAMDALLSGDGDDILRGWDGDELLSGGRGDDVIEGRAGDDTLTGGAGEDRFVLTDGMGDDAITDFETGTDMLILSQITGTVSEGANDAGDRVLTLVDGSSLTLTGVASVVVDNTAPEGGVTITGAMRQGETLMADLSRLSNADGLGEPAYAWLRDGEAVTGESGASYVLTQDDVGARIALRVTYTDAGGTTEVVTATPLTQGPVVGTVLAIEGDAGRNRLQGSALDEALFGYGGQDTLIGGGGDDTLTGGAGSDFFAFQSSDAGGPARITDFTRGQDRLAIDDQLFGLGDGSIDPRDVTDQQVENALEFRAFNYRAYTGELFVDADGRGGPADPILIAIIEGGGPLTQDDVLLF